MSEIANGLYIVIEGMDGSGKSTLARNIALQLNATLQCFPTKTTPIGTLISEAFAGKSVVAPRAMAHLLLADGYQEEGAIVKLLEEGKTVVCDRHTLISGFVYQGIDFGVHSIMNMQLGGKGFRQPDIIFVCDLDEAIAQQRVEARAEARNVLFERKDMAYVQALRHRYVAYGMIHANTFLIDATLPPAELIEHVMNVLKQFFPQHPPQVQS